MNKPNYESTINKIVELYDKYGQSDYIGEQVTQTQHMLECAQLAETHLTSPTLSTSNKSEIILGALFHDIGHLVGLQQASSKMSTLGIHGHEHIGANALRQLGIPGLIPDLVEKHVLAKRYLTFKNPSYLNKLSSASKKTLIYQGGPMTQEQASKFEQDPHFNVILLLRTWDDQAKENIPVKPLSYYIDMLKDVLTAHSN